MMHCPRCNRPTVLRKQSRTGQENPPGLQAVLKNGTCDSCAQLARGRKKPRPASKRESAMDEVMEMLPPRFTREQVEGYELEKCEDRLEAWMQNRRARGIPEEGLHPGGLFNGGAYLEDVK